MLSRSEKKWLKEYNKAIVEALSSYLESEEVGWLTNACNY
jgi:hypothetical protein